MLTTAQKKKQGFVKEETQNGYAEGNYSNGIKTGTWIFTYPDRIEQGQMQGKLRIGNWLINYQNEDIQHIGKYDDKNLKTGDWEACSSQEPKVCIITEYKRGVQQGKEIRRDKLTMSLIEIKNG